ncbi:MAG: hypothetical protein IIZ54_01550 [Selenomonadaceae bacterium]|nr:hypothetical protein [Selenomonadaceae bacterium]
MREFLSVFAKRLLKSLGIVTLMVSLLLLSGGNGSLIGALLLGYFTGGIFVGTMVYRIWRSAGLSADGAKKQMLWGLVLRLGMLFIVLFTAVHISVQVFGVTVLGCLLFYGLSLVHLVQGNIDIKNF